jgi:ATP synthase protein I
MRNEQRQASPEKHEAGEQVRNHGSHVLERTVRQAVHRDQKAQDVPEPSLGARLGQIGILGWMVVIPALLGLWLGHWLDRRFDTGVFFAAPLLMAGAAIGLWLAWRWMHHQSMKD